MDYPITDYDRIPDLAAGLEFGDSEQRTPCVLVLDTSISMDGRPIAELNAGLRGLQAALQADELARRRVEVAVVTFGGTVAVRQGFVRAEEFMAPTLEAAGNTPLGAAVGQALDLVDERLRAYRTGRVPCTRPWVFLITDGAPTDAWQAAAARVHRLSAARQVAFFAVAVAGADVGLLAQVAAPERPPRQLAGLQFQELFEWLSVSLGSAARSVPGGQAALPRPDSWAAA
jgi:uncharacterized protein YegL